MEKFDTPPQNFFDFVAGNINADTSRLRLSLRGKLENFDLDFALTQITCRKKCRSKLSHFISSPYTLFPTETASEQASHEAVALFHASLADGADSILDMTAGLGIDSLAFACGAQNVISCEMDALKAGVLGYNIQTLGKDNLKVMNVDSISFLRNTGEEFDLIFIDPARRDDSNSRVYAFRDCRPDILTNLSLIRAKARRLLIKASPLLDITQTLRDIPETRAVRVVCVSGECKEILVETDGLAGKTLPALPETVRAEAIDLDREGKIAEKFCFDICRPNSEKESRNNDQNEKKETDGLERVSDSRRETETPEQRVRYASETEIQPGIYLYEPNAAVMKLAPWKELCSQFPGLKKLGKSSHLFISSEYEEVFPGRKLIITAVPDKKELRRLKGECLNAISRNHPLSAPELRKKYGLKEGDNRFLYATRLGERPALLIAEKC